MLKQSLPALDLPKVREWLSAYAKRISQNPCVCSVILFGSLVKGTYTRHSDADVLIVLRDSTKPFLDRIPDYLDPTVPLPLEALPYTMDEVREYLAHPPNLVSHAIAEGILLAGINPQETFPPPP